MFSLGCVLYECATGKRLIPEDVWNAPFTPDGFAGCCAVLPHPLRTILERMLAMEPDHRPGDPAHLATEMLEVARVLEGIGTRFAITVSAKGDFRVLFEKGPREAPHTVAGHPVPCFGRERELDLLESVWHEVCDQSVARAMIVSAPAGGGKTRLRQELCERIKRQGPAFELLVGGGDPMLDGVPLSVLGLAIMSGAGLTGGEPETVKRQRLMTQVESYLAPGQAPRVAAFLGQMAQVSFPEELPCLQAMRMNPRLLSDQMRMAWLDWLSAMCDRHPVMLVLEDLQWGDGASVALAGTALRVLQDKPLLVLALAQPEVNRRFMTLWREHAPQRIHLAPLSPRQGQRLIEYVAGSLSSTDVQEILERAQGTPFGLEESLRAALGGEPVGCGPPDTLAGMVQTRLRNLDHESRLALGACSVLGRGFRSNAVKAIVDSEDHLDVDRCLALLEKREILFSFASPAGREFAFRHSLVRQAAYDMLPTVEQRLGHVSAGHLLEQAGEHNAYLLAEHFSRGRDKPRAIHWLKRAASQALCADDSIGTLALVTRALKEGARDEDERALRLVEAQIRLWHEEHPEAVRAAEAAVSSTVAETQWMAKRTLLEVLVAQSRLDDVAEIVASLGPPPTQADLVGSWVSCLLKSVAFLATSQGASARERIREQLQGLSNPDALWAGDAEALRAQLAQAAGQPSQAQASYMRAADHYARVEDRRAECTTKANLGQLLLHTGQLEMAEDCLRSVLDAAKRLEFTPLLGRVATDLTRLLAYRGVWNEARQFGERARVIAEARNDRNARGEAACCLSLAALLAGSHLAAEKYAVEGAAGVEAGSKSHGFAQALLARALLAQGRTSEALHHARQAYARVEGPAALDGFEGTICLAMTECLRSMGDAASAREVLRRASARLEDSAKAITDPAARRSYLTELPENARVLQLCQQAGLGVPAP